MEKRRKNGQFKERVIAALMPFLAVLVAFLIGAVILLLQGVNPLEAYQSMIVGAFGSKNGLADTLVKSFGHCYCFSRWGYKHWG